MGKIPATILLLILVHPIEYYAEQQFPGVTKIYPGGISISFIFDIAGMLVIYRELVRAGQYRTSWLDNSLSAMVFMLMLGLFIYTPPFLSFLPSDFFHHHRYIVLVGLAGFDALWGRTIADAVHETGIAADRIENGGIAIIKYTPITFYCLFTYLFFMGFGVMAEKILIKEGVEGINIYFDRIIPIGNTMISLYYIYNVVTIYMGAAEVSRSALHGTSSKGKKARKQDDMKSMIIAIIWTALPLIQLGVRSYETQNNVDIPIFGGSLFIDQAWYLVCFVSWGDAIAGSKIIRAVQKGLAETTVNQKTGKS